MVKKEDILNWINEITGLVVENRDYLTQLDSPIGDADHGLNISRGFLKVQEKMQTIATDDIGEFFKQIAMVIISSVGGASGSLYGTMFLKSSAVALRKSELNDQEFINLLEVGIKAIQDRGKAVLGDKTMIDVWIPVLEKAKQEIISGKSLKDLMPELVQVAEQAKDATKDLVAKKGRASYLGARSVGHIDPGAMSSYLIIKALAKVI